MKKQHISLAALAAAGLLAGCSGALSTNGAAQTPPVQQANLSADKLEFAVGTANFQGTTYLNTVVSFRQPNGASAVLVDTPTITGPTGFTVPAVSSAGADAGTNHISATPQTAPTYPPAPPPPATTFGQAGGAFSYGFAPFNAGTTGAPNYPGHPALYAQPFYISPSAKVSFYGGPPAFPFFNDGTFPAGFLGYSQGFTMFGATPISGAYTLSVLVPAANAQAITDSVTANLNAGTVLGLPVVAGIVEDGSGGLSGTVTPGAGATETLVYINDKSAGLWYTVGPINGAAPATFTLPSNLAPCTTPGCKGSAPSIGTGDTYKVYAVSFDYPAFESAPPNSTSQTPTITGTGGQSDLSVSLVTSAAY